MDANAINDGARDVPEGEPSVIREICAVCCAPRRTTPYLMTHGVVLNLCTTHGALNYLRRNGGQTLVRRLMEVWAAHDMLSQRRRAALRGHLARVRRTWTKELPGSYSWKAQRKHAESRFARGDNPRDVIADVRDPSHFAGCPPSVRTVRRWLADGRWLTPPTPGPIPTAITAVLSIVQVLDAIDREAARFWHTSDSVSVGNRRAIALTRGP